MAGLVGLDIGTEFVRGVLVKASFGRTELLRATEAAVEPRSPDGLRDAIHAAIAALGPGTPDQVFVAVSGDAVSLRVLEPPAAVSKRLGDIVPFELESAIPYPVEDAVVDYHAVEVRDGKIRVLAAAAPRARVEARLEELRTLGVDPRALAVGGVALEGLTAWVEALKVPGPVALLDFGHATTELCILRGGRCELARTLSMKLGGQPARIDEIALATELRRTLVAYHASGGPALTGIFVSGDIAGAGTAAWLAETLQEPVSELPLPDVLGTSSLASGPLAFARAAALAGYAVGRQKRIDLRQGELAPKRAMGAMRRHARLASICAAAVLLSLGFSAYAQRELLDGERQALRQQLAEASRAAFGEETESAVRARELLAGGSRASDPLPRFDAFDILSAISERIPTDIVHDTRRLNIELDDDGHGGRFDLQGTVASISERDRIAGELEGHPCFREIEKGRTTPSMGAEKLNYELEVTVRCPGEPEPTRRRRR